MQSTRGSNSGVCLSLTSRVLGQKYMPSTPRISLFETGSLIEPRAHLIGLWGSCLSLPLHLCDSRNLQLCPVLYVDAGYLGTWTPGLRACIGSTFPDWAISRKFGLTLFEAFHAQDGYHKHQMTSDWEAVFQMPLKAHSQLSELQTLGFFLKELSSLHNQPDMQVIYKRVLAHNYKAMFILHKHTC